MKRLVLAVVVAATFACVFAAPVQARQEKTLASAHLFIKQMLTRGVQGFHMVDPQGYLVGVADIVSVSSYECTTFIEGQDEGGRRLSRRVNWRTVSSVGATPQAKVAVEGAIIYTDGDTFPALLLDIGNHDEASRIAAAMEFIRTKCDPTAGGVW